MKKLLLVILFLLSSLTTLAVRYVVDTKDGYANLREKADSKSKIIKKLKNNHEMFFGMKKENGIILNLKEKMEHHLIMAISIKVN